MRTLNLYCTGEGGPAVILEMSPHTAGYGWMRVQPGIALFTLSSAAAAVAPSTGTLIAARAIQGLGAAIVTPLTLTLLADAFPPQRRGVAIGIWSAISGVAVALGPLVGGAVIQLASWHYIFWINVPVGAALMPLSIARLSESRGESRHLDLTGLGLASSGLFGSGVTVVL